MESVRKHEVAFCAEVSKWADKLFENATTLPFGSSDIESFGRGSQKRQDFRVYEREERGQGSGQGKLALCGEVKLPGNPQGRTPFDFILMQDAYSKATAENCRYFFTWNLEELALFDRSLWDAETMHERCIGQWKLGLQLDRPTDVARPEVIAKLRDDFLPRFFSDFAEIWTGRKASFAQPPSDFYITVLESHLSGPLGPVRETRDYLAIHSERSSSFDARLRHWLASEQQWTFDRSDPASWRKTIDRAARSMVYVLSNRILFYQAVRLRNRLPELRFPRRARTPETALEYLRQRFQEAVDMTGDYEPVFFPEEKEWAALIALSGTNAIESWGKVISAVERFYFKEIPTDILGHIFQKLISPEERHKFGQHYTDENIVDVINAFCIRKGTATVLDPACGSGSFLVRAYYRKFILDRSLVNHELIECLYGCDINPFPAHLATLNLAARNITNEENYPRIARRNFFTVEKDRAFCEIPKATRDRQGQREREQVVLPAVDAVIGNPPYVRYQDIPRASDKGVIRTHTKEYIGEVAEIGWPGLTISKQSDLHVYFWPAAARFLSDDGWFGFLTSSSWLDARYGFALQRWILLNFKILTVLESAEDPWFEDARVKTAVIVMQRCKQDDLRGRNLVRFVRLMRPLAEILGPREDEVQRQAAAEKLRDLILRAKNDVRNSYLRILVRRQSDLWAEGEGVARMFAKQKALGDGTGDSSGDDEEEGSGVGSGQANEHLYKGVYGGGKWGRYLRAPDFYFDVMREFGGRFVRLGEIATIRYGILSGCDGFFMPRNVSAKLLAEHRSELSWSSLPIMSRCKRQDVESGKVVIVECSDGTLHPIESEFLRPEVHSLMQVDRPVVTADQLDRVVLWVNQPLKELKGTFVHQFISWGTKQTFQSKKSKSVPIPERPGCAGRSPWYDLTGRKPGIGFWPMAQKYRHIIPSNPYRLPCNHNLFDIHPQGLTDQEERALMAILNSTLVGFFKHFYGRYAGSEGTLKTEIVDALMIEIPCPVGISVALCNRLADVLDKITRRDVTHLVEQSFLDCHTEEDMRTLQAAPLRLPVELEHEDRRMLDALTFEVLGVRKEERREALVNQLYRESTLYYREQRIQDIQSTINRSKTSGRRSPSHEDLAEDAWREVEPDLQQPLSQWLSRESDGAQIINIPDGAIRLPDAGHFFEATTVFFGSKPGTSHVCANRPQAELLAGIASAGLRGPVSLPMTESECRELNGLLNARLERARRRFGELSESRAGTERLREAIAQLLYRWFLHGRPTAKAD